jgi:hypothetical protein
MRRFPHPHFPIRLALIVGCLVFFSLGASAQTGVYAEFSTSDFNVTGVGRQYGPTFGLYHNVWRPPFLGIGFDLRATLLGSGGTKAYMGFVGPRIQLRPRLVPLMPYVEGLVGAGNVQVGGAGSVVSKTALAYEGVAGIDWTILPRLDWRIVEFSTGGFSSLNASISPRTWSTGLVLRLP